MHFRFLDEGFFLFYTYLEKLRKTGDVICSTRKKLPWEVAALDLQPQNLILQKSTFTYRDVNHLLNLLLWLHGHCSRMCLRLVTYILLELVGWSLPLALHSSSTPHLLWHLLWLSHTPHMLTRTSRSTWLLLLTRDTPGRSLTDCPCTQHLTSCWHSTGWGMDLLLWLQGLPARTHLLHLWCVEWAPSSLQETGSHISSRRQNLNQLPIRIHGFSNFFDALLIAQLQWQLFEIL